MTKIGTLFRSWKILFVSFLGMVMVFQPPSAQATKAHLSDQILLELALHKISQKYDVHFNYDRDIMKEVMVDYEENNAFSLAEALDHVFENTHFGYRIFEERYIVVFENNDEGTESLKNMINHMQDLVEERESVKKRTVEPVIQLSTLSAKDLYHKRIVFSVSGTVTDDGGEPLIGVNIQVKGSNKGTSTDFDGRFTLDDIDENAVLVVSYIGYQTQEVSVAGKTSLEIIMTSDSQLLDEVVVVGYGTQKKISTTSSVSQLKGDELTKRPVSNLQQSLQGLAPGLTVLDRGGAPGKASSATIRIRGITSFSGNTDNSEPLVIVDGIEQSMYNINPEDVESISVLKDASSTAIYGSRAANGVVLITTKRGSIGEPQVSYSGYFGLQKSTNVPKNMETVSFMRYQQLAYQNQGLPVPAHYSDDYINNWINSNDRDKYPHANKWPEYVLSPALQHNHNVSVSGGNEYSQTRISLRYMNQDGIAPNYGANVKEIRINNDIKLIDRVKFSTDINYRNDFAKAPFRQDVFNRFFHGTLFAAPKYSDGTYGLSPQGFNPLLLAEQSGYRHDKTNYLVLNGKLEYSILDNLSVIAQVSNVRESLEGKYYQNIVDNIDKNNGRRFQLQNNTLTEARNRFNETTTNLLANYSKDFNNNEIKVLVGFSQIYNVSSNLNAYRERFYNNEIQSLSQGANDVTKNNSGVETEFGLRSYFSRINYSYKEKYLVEINGRVDGSSRFTGANKYSFFPSMSAAWRISEEPFFQNLNSPITELKIRSSWGETGNQTVPLYSYYASLSQGAYSFGGQPAPSLSQMVLSDPNITWETNTQSVIGIDGGILNNKIFWTAEFYKKRTKDILLALPVASITGFTSSSRNAGVMDNKGFEFSLGYNGQVKKTEFQLQGNFTINNNKVIDLMGGGPFINSSYDLDPRYIVMVGLPFNAHWGYKTDGFFQSQQEIENYPTIAPDTKPGDLKYVDLNEDGVINADDWTMIGNPFPKYTFGATGNVKYSNFSLYLQLQGVGNVDTRLSGALSEFGIFEGFTHTIVTDNYWTPERPNAEFPLPRKSDQRNVNTSDMLILDGSYLRLKNLQVSYSIPSVKAIGMRNIDVYVSASDLLTISKLNRWNIDPEAPSGRLDYYPQTRMYTLGFNINF